ncbi:transposase [Aquimarina sp. 2-A2]|uniref:transposase n=1 Tax=Aquimarina sp. 2-A2 TaxID=3382644 RepID=UPI00387F28BD
MLLTKYRGKRKSTVEPVFGTSTQFMGLRKTNTIVLKQANKVMHMAAIAYNLKKYLKFIKKNPIRKEGVHSAHIFQLECFLRPGIKRLKQFVLQELLVYRFRKLGLRLKVLC